MNLPVVIPTNGRLPDSYQAARNALATCSSVDECKDWADKAAALASYAKQADDDELFRLATRIRGRAIRRAGELLREFDGRGGDRTKTDGAVSFAPTQKEAAEAAGFSERQQVQAVRVANVPLEQFESAIESDSPPTITALSEQGRRHRDVVDFATSTPAFHVATTFGGFLRPLFNFCNTNEPAVVASGCMAQELTELVEQTQMTDAWLNRFRDLLEQRDQDGDL